MESQDVKNDVMVDVKETRLAALKEANIKAQGTAKAKAKAKDTSKAQGTAKAKEKGVIIWQKGLRPLRDLVNLAQLNAESTKDKSIALRLSQLAKVERARIEKTETIPARLNRRFGKYCKA